MKPFTRLTKSDVERLRRKKPIGNANYSFSEAELEAARNHLQHLYPDCKVQKRFASTTLLLNELY